MLDQRTYSIADLERATGFDRRTIVYYMQFGLLARPGRRGPKTRYPGEAMVRLQFVRGVKDLQDRGELLNFTLHDIHHAIEKSGLERIADLLERRMPVAEIAPLLTAPVAAAASTPEAEVRPALTGSLTVTTPIPAAPAEMQPAPQPQERRAFGLADASIRQRFPPSPQPPPPAAGESAQPAGATAPASPPVDLGELSRLLRELEIRPAMSGRRLAPGAAEQWTEIPITSRVYLSVRGLSAEDAPLADAVARALKRVLRAA